MMQIYEYKSYKSYLKQALAAKKRQVSSRFNYDRMAKACGIQKTYLSRVLNNETSHLSEEQLFHAAGYLGLSYEEQKFLQLLRNYQRADRQDYKNELAKEIKSIAESQHNSETYLNAETFHDSADVSAYFLDPNKQLVHVFLAVDKFRKNLKLLASSLKITDAQLSRILTELEQMQLIKLTDEGYQLLKESVHLSHNSSLYLPYRFMQRLKTIERIQAIPNEQSYNFSAVFTADEKTRKLIKQKFLHLLKTIEELAGQSEDEEVYQLNFDLFDWSLQRDG